MTRPSHYHPPQTGRHVAGHYRSDLPPPDQRGRGGYIRRPGCVLAAVFVVCIVCVVATTLAALLLLGSPSLPPGDNAIWLGIDWGELPQTDQRVRNLVNGLSRYGIGTVYLWTSWLQEDETWSETTFEHIGTFVEQFKRFYPESRLFAWIGLSVVLPDYRLDNAALRTQVATFAQRTITEFGFDGVHLNAEPVWSEDENYAALLREVRQYIGPDVPLSVAVPPDWNTGTPGIPASTLTTTDAMWSQDYKQLIGFLVDEVVVMAYNSGLSTADDYQTWMAFQVSQFASALAPISAETRLVIGIPTYDAEPPGHDPAVENIPSATAGIQRQIAADAVAAARVSGISLYAYWTTDASEWDAYRRLWLGRPAE